MVSFPVTVLYWWLLMAGTTSDVVCHYLVRSSVAERSQARLGIPGTFRISYGPEEESLRTAWVCCCVVEPKRLSSEHRPLVDFATGPHTAQAR